LDILAGKMTFDGKRVSPDPRKGLLRLVIDEVTDSVKLQWLDRSNESPVVESEWVSPVSIEPVPSVKTGKVLVLKPECGDKQFVWIQQQSNNAAGDAAGFTAGSVDNIEALINQFQMFAQMRSGKDAAETYSQIFGEEAIGDDQMLVDLGDHDHHDHDDDDDEEGDLDYEALVEQLMQGAGDGEVLSDQVLALMLMDPEIQQQVFAYFIQLAAAYLAKHPASATHANPQPQGSPSQGPAPVQVSSILLSDESVKALTSDPETVNRLLAMCPPGETELESVLRSPQFGETLRSLTEGVYSDQIAVLFQSIGLDMKDIIGAQDPLEALCRAMESKFRRNH